MSVENIVKAQPTASQVHIDRPLTDVSIAYIQGQDEFIADKVFKPIKSDKQSNMYYKFEKEYFLSGGSELQVAEGAPTKSSGFGLTTDTYICKVYGFSHMISDEARANQDEAVNLDKTATMLVTSRLLITKEKMFANTAFNATAWSHSATGAATASANQFVYWDDENGDPIVNVRKARMAVKKSTGFAPNVMVISEDVFEVLCQHPKIIDRYKYTTSNVITADMLAKLFELKRIEIAKAIAINDGVAEGSDAADQDASYGWIMTNGALLLYVPDQVSVLQPASGYGFYWTGLAGAGTSEKGVAIKTYRSERRRSDIVEGLTAFEYKVVCKDLGYFFKNCLKSS